VTGRRGPSVGGPVGRLTSEPLVKLAKCGAGYGPLQVLVPMNSTTRSTHTRTRGGLAAWD
jgi:hypothetical protein